MFVLKLTTESCEGAYHAGGWSGGSRYEPTSDWAMDGGLCVYASVNTDEPCTLRIDADNICFIKAMPDYAEVTLRNQQTGSTTDPPVRASAGVYYFMLDDLKRFRLEVISGP